MGYTHYWDYDGDAETFSRTALDAKAIVEYAKDTLDISICGPLGTGAPVFTEGEIALNGDESRGEDYETFSVRAGQATGFDFCKTRGDKPYDAVVTAILMRLVYNGNAYDGGNHAHVSSDGEWGEWMEGRKIVAHLFNVAPESEAVFNR